MHLISYQAFIKHHAVRPEWCTISNIDINTLKEKLNDT